MQMTTAEKVELIQGLVDLDKRLEGYRRSLNELFGVKVDCDAGLYEDIYDLFYKHLELISKSTGISKESLYWFFWETDCCSEPGFLESEKGDRYLIESVNDFVKFQEKHG